MRSAVLLVVASCSEPFGEAEPIAPPAPSAPSVQVQDASTEHDDHDAGACETIGRTGPPGACMLFATCGHRRFELDCSARFTCVCSESSKQIAAEPAFCESPATELASAFAAARRACDW